MSEFRIGGTASYLSEFGGNDANAGNTPEAPKRNLLATPTANVIAGTGHYTINSSVTKSIIGDGKVVVESVGGSFSVGNTPNITNVHLKYCRLFSPTLTDCIIEGGLDEKRGTRTRCLYIGQITYLAQNFTGFQNNCFFARETFNTVNISPNVYSHCFLAKEDNLTIRNETVRDQCINNLWNGKIYYTPTATYYELKKLFDGSPRPDADAGISDLIDVYPDVYVNGNFASVNTRIVDVMSKTVELGSDLLLRRNSNGFIGGVRVGKYINFKDANFEVEVNGLDQSNPDILIAPASPNGSGYVRFVGKFSDSLVSSASIVPRTRYFFRSQELGGTALNNNAPDIFTETAFGTDVGGLVVNRLKFWVRSSQLDNPSKNFGPDWDNGVSGIPGKYYLMEFDRPMAHHIVASIAYGNADKDALNSEIVRAFSFKCLDIIIELTNERENL
jgi:hypothetical protein